MQWAAGLGTAACIPGAEDGWGQIDSPQVGHCPPSTVEQDQAGPSSATTQSAQPWPLLLMGEPVGPGALRPGQETGGRGGPGMR